MYEAKFNPVVYVGRIKMYDSINEFEQIRRFIFMQAHQTVAHSNVEFAFFDGLASFMVRNFLTQHTIEK